MLEHSMLSANGAGCMCDVRLSPRVTYLKERHTVRVNIIWQLSKTGGCYFPFLDSCVS